MKTRHFDILNYIVNESKKRYTISEISKITDVTERTVRYDIDIINNFLKEQELPEIQVKKGEIYSDKNLNPIVLQGLSEDRKLHDLDQSKRYELIMEYVLLNNGINITKFSRENLVSRGTVKNDLEELKKEIKSLGIEILNTGEGIKVIGSEEVIRKKLLSIFNTKRIKKYLNFSEAEKLIDKTLENLEKTTEKIFPDETHRILKNYLLISYIRSKKGLFLEGVKNREFYKNTPEFEIISKAMKGIIDNEEELINITNLFIGINYRSMNDYYFDYWLNFELKIKNFIQEVGSRLKVNMSHDKELFESLNNHMKPAIYRVLNEIKLKNSIHEEVQKNYSELLEIVSFSLRDIESFIGKKFTEDEIAFVLMHFNVSLEKLKISENLRKKILIVCNYGIGSSRLLSNQMEEIFEVEILGVIPFRKILKFDDYKNLDVIITTVNFGDMADFKTQNIIKISPLLSKEDIINLEKLGFIRKNRKEEVEFEELFHQLKKGTSIKDESEVFKILAKYIPNLKRKELEIPKLKQFIIPKYVNVVDEVLSWEKAIELGCFPLIGENTISKTYQENIKEAIKKYGSYMVIKDGIMMPHSRNNNDVFKTSASFLLLKNPISFPDGKEVSFLFTFASIDDKNHIRILTDFLDLISNDLNYKKLMSSKNSLELLEILEKKHEEIEV